MEKYEIELEGGVKYQIELEDSSSEATTQPKENLIKQGNPFIEGLKTTGSILSGAFQRQTREGLSSDTLTGGPGQQFGQNVKREVLNRVMPGDDLIASSAREAIVQGTYPGNLLLGGMAGLSMSSSRLGRLASGIKNSSGNIKSVESEIANLSKLPSESAINTGTKQGLKALKDARTSLIGQETLSSKKAVDSLTNEFKQQNASIQNRLKQATTIETSDYKGAIKSTFGNVNKKYGEGISSAEDAMIARGDSISKEEYVERVINKTIQDAQARGIPDDDMALKQINSLSEKLKEGVSAQETLGINEAKNIKNEIYSKLSGGVKRGSSPLSENHDQISNMFIRNHAELLGEKSPELSKLNTEVAPMYEARRWAYSKFKPYRPMEIEKGASILEKIATGGKVNADDVNYLRTLEQGSGRFQGTGALRKASSEIGKDISLSSKTFNESKQRLI